jgi:FAD binding domain
VDEAYLIEEQTLNMPLFCDNSNKSTKAIYHLRLKGRVFAVRSISSCKLDEIGDVRECHLRIYRPQKENIPGTNHMLAAPQYKLCRSYPHAPQLFSLTFYNPLRSPMAQVIVVGGGLAGLSAAHTLLERGANVLLLDKQGYVLYVELRLANNRVIQFHGWKLYQGYFWYQWCRNTDTADERYPRQRQNIF